MAANAALDKALGKKRDLRNLDGKEKFAKKHAAEIKEYLGYDTGYFEQLAEKAPREKGLMGWNRRFSEVRDSEEALGNAIDKRDAEFARIRKNFDDNHEAEIQDGLTKQGRDPVTGLYTDEKTLHGKDQKWKKEWGIFEEPVDHLRVDREGRVATEPGGDLQPSWFEKCFPKKKKKRLEAVEQAQKEFDQGLKDAEWYRMRGIEPPAMPPRWAFTRNATDEEKAKELQDKPKLKKLGSSILEKAHLKGGSKEMHCHTGLLPTDVDIKEKGANKINLAQIMINAKWERWKKKHPLDEELQNRVRDDEEYEKAYLQRKEKRDVQAQLANRRARDAGKAARTGAKKAKAGAKAGAKGFWNNLKGIFLTVFWLVKMIITIFILYPLDAIADSFEESYIGRTCFPFCKRRSKKAEDQKLLDEEREEREAAEKILADKAVEREDKRRRRERRRRNRMRRLRFESKKRRKSMAQLKSFSDTENDVLKTGSSDSSMTIGQSSDGSDSEDGQSSKVSEYSNSTDKSYISKRSKDEEHMAILDAAILRKNRKIANRKADLKAVFEDISESEDASEDELAGMGKNVGKGKATVRKRVNKKQGTMSTSGLLSFLFDNINNWMGKCGILMLTAKANVFPPLFRGVHINTSFLASFGLGSVDLGFPQSEHFILGGMMTVFAFLFARGIMMHTQYCCFVPTDQTGLWLYDSNENTMKQTRNMKGEVWWSDWLSHYFLKYWLRANHQDNIPCRQWWEFMFVERWWPKRISAAHRKWVRDQDREFMLDGTIYKGQMMEKRQQIWARVVAVVDSKGNKDHSKTGWYQVGDTQEQGKARSMVFWDEIQILKEGCTLTTKIMEDPEEDPTPYLVCSMSAGERVQYLEYKAFDRVDIGKQDAGELLGREGRGEHGMVVDVGALNRATESRTVMIRNMRTGKVASMQHDQLQPARLYSSPHLDESDRYTWYLNMGTSFGFTIYNVFVLPALWLVPGFYFLCKSMQQAGKDPPLWMPGLASLDDTGFDYEIAYFLCLGFSGMFMGSAGVDLARVLLLRKTWDQMHFMDYSMTEMYELKLAECNFDAVSTGLRPQLQATYDYWTVVPSAEVSWMLTVLQAWQIPTVNSACRLVFEREGDIDDLEGEIAVTWTTNAFNMFTGLSAFFFCTGGLLMFFTTLRITKETEYGAESRTEYAAEMSDAFVTPIRSSFKELNLLETTLFSLASVYFTGEEQLLACFYLTISGFVVVMVLQIFRDPRPNRSLIFTKGTLALLIAGAYMNVKYGTNPDGSTNQDILMMSEIFCWFASGTVALQTVYEVDPIQQYKNFKVHLEERKPKMEVAIFSEAKAAKTKTKNWTPEHMKILTTDQRGWLLRSHLKELGTKWRVLDYGAGEHGPALMALRGGGAACEFMLLDKTDPQQKGIEILACQDCPSLKVFPDAVRDCPYLKIVNFSSCYNMGGPLPAWLGDMEYLERLYIDETQIYDPIPEGKVINGIVEKPAWMGYVYIWKEIPTTDDFDDRLNFDFKVRKNRTRVEVTALRDIGGGRMMVRIKKWIDPLAVVGFAEEVGIGELQRRKRLAAQGIVVVEEEKDPDDFEGWCDGMCIDRHVKDELVGQATQGVKDKRCSDLHLVEGYVKKRWEHLNVFQWSWGEKTLLQQRIELDRRLQSMLG